MRPVKDDEFPEMACTVRSEDEVAGGVLADFFDGHGLAQSVVDVEVFDAVTPRGGQ